MSTKGTPLYGRMHPEREALFWASAVRRQLSRWEPLAAKHALIYLQLRMKPLPKNHLTMSMGEIWQGQMDWHFLLVSVSHLFKAIRLLDDSPAIDPVVRSELIEARDLNEHWIENMPVFNSRPRPEPGYPSGKRFAERNPEGSPYWWCIWDLTQGPLVTPNVSAAQLRKMLDEVINVAGGVDDGLAAHMAPLSPIPWIEPSGGMSSWWPDPGKVAGGPT